MEPGGAGVDGLQRRRETTRVFEQILRIEAQLASLHMPLAASKRQGRTQSPSGGSGASALDQHLASWSACRYALLLAYEQLIIGDPVFVLQGNLLDALWRRALYAVVEEMRSALIERSRDGAQCAAVRAHTCAIIDEGIGYFVALIQAQKRLVHRHHSRPPSARHKEGGACEPAAQEQQQQQQQLSPQEERHGELHNDAPSEATVRAWREIIAECLVCLGDLYRYRHAFCTPRTGEPSAPSIETSLATAYFLDAIRHNAACGKAYNQLAIMACAADSAFEGLALYLRAATAREPFPLAEDNLRIIAGRLVNVGEERLGGAITTEPLLAAFFGLAIRLAAAVAMAGFKRGGGAAGIATLATIGAIAPNLVRIISLSPTGMAAGSAKLSHPAKGLFDRATGLTAHASSPSGNGGEALLLLLSTLILAIEHHNVLRLKASADETCLGQETFDEHKSARRAALLLTLPQVHVANVLFVFFEKVLRAILALISSGSAAAGLGDGKDEAAVAIYLRLLAMANAWLLHSNVVERFLCTENPARNVMALAQLCRAYALLANWQRDTLGGAPPHDDEALEEDNQGNAGAIARCLLEAIPSGDNLRLAGMQSFPNRFPRERHADRLARTVSLLVGGEDGQLHAVIAFAPEDGAYYYREDYERIQRRESAIETLIRRNRHSRKAAATGDDALPSPAATGDSTATIDEETRRGRPFLAVEGREGGPSESPSAEVPPWVIADGTMLVDHWAAIERRLRSGMMRLIVTLSALAFMDRCKRNPRKARDVQRILRFISSSQQTVSPLHGSSKGAQRERGETPPMVKLQHPSECAKELDGSQAEEITALSKGQQSHLAAIVYFARTIGSCEPSQEKETIVVIARDPPLQSALNLLSIDYIDRVGECLGSSPSC